MVNQGMYGKTTSPCEFLQSCDRPCWACESGDKDSEHQPARNLLYWSEKEILPPYNVVHKDSRSPCEQPPIVIKADMWTGVGPVSIVCSVYKWCHLLWAHPWYLALIRLCLRILDIQLLPPLLSAVRFQIPCSRMNSCLQLDLGTSRKHLNSGCLI